MKRFLKQHVARFLPDRVRGFIRGHFESTFEQETPVRRRLELTHLSDGTIRCEFGEERAFLAPEDFFPDLEVFTATPRDRTEFDFLAGTAERGGVFFDIGAHVGITSALFCAAHPASRVFSFEPSPLLRPRLEAIAALNGFGPRLHIEPVGIGERTETLEMLVDPAGGFVQTQRFEHSMTAEPQAIQVKLESLADAAARLGVTPDFIKLDIEGYEHEAICGAADFLARLRPEILLEIHLDYLQQRGQSAHGLIATLEKCGYGFSTYAGRPLRARQITDSPLPNIHVIARPN